MDKSTSQDMLSTKGKFKSIIGYIGENKFWSLPPSEKDQSCPSVTWRLSGRLEKAGTELELISILIPNQYLETNFWDPPILFHWL